MISEMILRVRRLNQQCHTTEGYRLVNHVKSQSLEAQLTIRQEKDVTKKKFTTYEYRRNRHTRKIES